MKLLPRVSPNSVMNGHSEIDSDRGRHFITLMYRTKLKLCTLQPSGSELVFLNRVTQQFKSLGTRGTLNEWKQVLPKAINMSNENPSTRNGLPSYELLLYGCKHKCLEGSLIGISCPFSKTVAVTSPTGPVTSPDTGLLLAYNRELPPMQLALNAFVKL